MPTKKPKLLIAGGGYSEIPLIEAGKSLGFHVISSGNRLNDLGHLYADEVQLLDYSDMEAMLKLAKKLQIDAICAGCNDFSALTAAYVAEKLSLPGHDSFTTANLIHHKDLYRQFAQLIEIPTPRANGFNTVNSALAELNNLIYPIIIKPVDLTGGKGISTANNAIDAKSAIIRAFEISRAKRIVIEEFIQGSRHGISTLLLNGKVSFYFHDDEYYYQNPFLVSAASSPGSLSDIIIKNLIETIELIAHRLDIRMGLVHVQFIVNTSGMPVIIEICRRAPGDLYLRLVQHATGFNYSEYIVRAATGLDCSSIKQYLVKKYITRHCIMSNKNGIIKNVSINKKIQNKIFDQMIWWKIGDQIEHSLTHKLGIVFLQFDSISEMRQITPDLHELIKVDIC